MGVIVRWQGRGHRGGLVRGRSLPGRDVGLGGLPEAVGGRGVRAEASQAQGQVLAPHQEAPSVVQRQLPRQAGVLKVCRRPAAIQPCTPAAHSIGPASERGARNTSPPACPRKWPLDIHVTSSKRLAAADHDPGGVTVAVVDVTDACSAASRSLALIEGSVGNRESKHRDDSDARSYFLPEPLAPTAGIEISDGVTCQLLRHHLFRGHF